MDRLLTDRQQTIVSTVAYFNVFEYPPTAVEIWKWLYQPRARYSLGQIINELNSGELAGLVEQRDGFYFLPGAATTIETRLERYRLAKKKFSIALRGAAWLRRLPFVELIAVCNNVGYNNATVKSDVDFFIIVEKNRLWWTRLWATLVMTVLRLRRHGRHSTDRVCLSFYVGSDHLDLSDIALRPNDPYLVYWLATLVPLYDRGGVYARLLAANRWLRPSLPNWYPNHFNNCRLVFDTAVTIFLKKLDWLWLRSALGDWLEALARKIQLKRVQRYFGAAVSHGDRRVVISASMLKFHKTDRRAEYRQRWHDKLSAITH